MNLLTSSSVFLATVFVAVYIHGVHPQDLELGFSGYGKGKAPEYFKNKNDVSVSNTDDEIQQGRSMVDSPRSSTGSKKKSKSKKKKRKNRKKLSSQELSEKMKKKSRNSKNQGREMDKFSFSSYGRDKLLGIDRESFNPNSLRNPNNDNSKINDKPNSPSATENGGKQQETNPNGSSTNGNENSDNPSKLNDGKNPNEKHNNDDNSHSNSNTGNSNSANENGSNSNGDNPNNPNNNKDIQPSESSPSVGNQPGENNTPGNQAQEGSKPAINHNGDQNEQNPINRNEQNAGNKDGPESPNGTNDKGNNILEGQNAESKKDMKPNRPNDGVNLEMPHSGDDGTTIGGNNGNQNNVNPADPNSNSWNPSNQNQNKEDPFHKYQNWPFNQHQNKWDPFNTHQNKWDPFNQNQNNWNPVNQNQNNWNPVHQNQLNWNPVNQNQNNWNPVNQNQINWNPVNQNQNNLNPVNQNQNNLNPVNQNQNTWNPAGNQNNIQSNRKPLDDLDGGFSNIFGMNFGLSDYGSKKYTGGQNNNRNQNSRSMVRNDQADYSNFEQINPDTRAGNAQLNYKQNAPVPFYNFMNFGLSKYGKSKAGRRFGTKSKSKSPKLGRVVGVIDIPREKDIIVSQSYSPEGIPYGFTPESFATFKKGISIKHVENK